MKQLSVSFSFHMPNYFSTPVATPAAVKVVLQDGKVHEFDEPLTVAELMLEHPQQVVVEFQSDLMKRSSGRKVVVPLSADKKLDTSKVYLMLPFKRGKPFSLSSEEARRVVLSANVALKQPASSSTKFMPVFARMCTSNSREGHYEGMFATRKKSRQLEMKVNKVEDDIGKKRLLSFFEEEDEEELEMCLDDKLSYLSRQLSGKGWRPSLDTIKEKKIEQQKFQHWLF